MLDDVRSVILFLRRPRTSVTSCIYVMNTATDMYGAITS